MIGLNRVGNNIITSEIYPTGVKKFAKFHRKISGMYDTIVGKEPNIDKFHDAIDYIEANRSFRDRFEKLMGLNLWAGANISQKVVGKHKIPRYLYHITTKENYNKMLKDGYLRISEDCPRGKGLYMFEMQNMIKQYRDFDGNRSLGRLLNQVIANQVKEAVLLKIPTSLMSPGKLVVRSNKGNGRNGMNSLTKTALGDSALASKLYKQRKAALEYIYPEQIPMDNISLVGTAKFTDFIQKSNDWEWSIEDIALKIWKKLTENQPEQKGFLNHIFKVEKYKDIIPQPPKRKRPSLDKFITAAQNFYKNDKNLG